MKIKVASICPTTEKEIRNGEVVHKYPYPGASVDEAVALADAMVDGAVPMLRRAAEAGAQIACLPEGLTNLGRWRRQADAPSLHEAWKRTWEHFCRTLSDAARETHMHVIAGAVEPDGGRFYNAAALFDDGGNLLGSYHKVQLAVGEGEKLTPGEALDVFDTRYGKVGIFTCWDIMYPEVVQTLMLKGAEILFEPTYGHSGAQADFMAQARAHDAGCPLVISMWCGNGRIIDRDGTILARGGMFRDWRGIIPDQIIHAEIDPQAKRPFLGHDDYRQAMLATRRWDLFGPLAQPSA